MRASLLALALALAACTTNSPSIRRDAIGEACSRDDDCAAGSQCASITGFANAPEGAVCVKGDSPCDALSCDGLSCVVNESYPPQVHCE